MTRARARKLSQRRASFFPRALLPGALLIVGAAAWMPLACTATKRDSGFGGAGGDDGDPGSTTGMGGAGGIPDITVGNGGSGGGSCEVHCSPDLHQVLDCNNNVVTTCPADQGCGPNGTCVAPCESAVANASTLGCEFWAAAPSVITQSQGGCYAVLLANTWSAPIDIQVEHNGVALDMGGLARVPTGSGGSLTYEALQNGKLDPGQLAVLFLSQVPGKGIACPAGVTPGLASDTSIPGTGIAKAFHLITSAPVVAYDIYPYGGAASYVSGATLLVPTPAWGVNYIAADGYEQEPAFAGLNASPFVQVVASEDATQVTISPTKAIAGGPGVAATPQGQPATYTINKGEVLQFFQPEELAGSPISADKPVGVWGGSGCMNIPIGKYACDSGHQQIMPVKSLGSEYVAVRYRDRVPGANESVPWTLIGAVNGTKLTYDPAPPAGAPATLESGQMVRFSTSDVFSVKSQDAEHPFSVAGHMTGWTNLPSTDAGDADYVIAIPPKQYLARYLFLTDPTYATSHLVFVRKKAMDGMFKPVTLDCMGEVKQWQPLGAAGQYEFAQVDLIAGFVPQNGCDNGVHTASSDEPFGLTVWGWDYAVSYAYPAGMSTQPINTVVVEPVPK